MPRLCCPKIVLPDKAPPQGWTLREAFDIVCPQATPRGYYQQLACQAYPRPDMPAEATEWAWSGTAIFYKPLRPEMAGVLTVMMAAGGQSIIDLVIQGVLTVIADLVDRGDLKFTAVHPVKHKRFRPAGGVLRTPIAQPDRHANCARREDGQVLADLRFFLPPANTTRAEEQPSLGVNENKPAPQSVSCEDNTQAPVEFYELDDVLIAMSEVGVRPGKNEKWKETTRQAQMACGRKYHPLTLQRHWKALGLPRT